MVQAVRYGFGSMLLSLLIILAIGCQPSFSPGTFTDDIGRPVSIEEPPQRIVSHVPGITEILFALGLDSRVVGVSDFCNYPEGATGKAKVGGFYSPSIESIVDLTPDMVLTNGEIDKLVTQLDSLAMSYMVLHPKDVGGILGNIKLVGAITGTEGSAEKVTGDIEKRMSDVASRVQDARRVKVFYTFATTDLNSPWTAGPGSFVDSLIALAGGENVGAGARAAWAQFSMEEVVSADPEVIIVDAKMGTAVTSIQAIRQHPVWRGIKAVKQERIYIIDGDLVNRAGPRIVQGLEEMARMIHPELFN